MKNTKDNTKEIDKAMQEMECWETQNHLKKCSKCRNKVLAEAKRKGSE